ncbi:hypothetical protein HAX54_038112 [Datura stramonium]|uniref:Sulfotransferase n=1 Tax=Datura stramonium TaxID=4076 RepID=A0ABS8VKJ5_DATST|nr:hypothetical protein [Datura stramonium]
MSDRESQALHNEDMDKFIEQLPKALFWGKEELCKWEGFWFSPNVLMKPAMMFQATFKADPDDVLLASSMKTGSTWLKALCFSIMQGNKEEEDLLVKDNFHFHVPVIEAVNYFLLQILQIRSLHNVISKTTSHSHTL